MSGPADSESGAPRHDAGGRLFVVATPIGNLEDVTARALRVLREADAIAAEDTRVTRRLLAHFDIHTPLVSYHAHSDPGREASLLERMRRGERIALVSDAGTPCVSDPGAELVAAAVDAGIPVEPIPGASAILSALVGSGLPPGRFAFEGFLPRTGDRRERLREVAAERRTVVLYESPHRLCATLDELAAVCGPERRCAVGRELTKRFEEFVRGTLADVAGRFRETAPRGECVVVLEGATEAPVEADAPSADDLLRDALARGLSARDAAREVAARTGLSRRDLYARLSRGDLSQERGDGATNCRE